MLELQNLFDGLGQGKRFEEFYHTLNMMLQELEKSDIAALRNNLVVMLTDFCVRYTALVDW